MKKIIIVFALSLVPMLSVAGTVNLDYHHTVELTDAVPSVTRIVECEKEKDLFAFVTIDKGATVVITPLILKDNDTVVGPVSTTLTFADGGGTDVALYSRIGTPRAKVVVTKTEAGTSSGFTLDIRGGE